MSKLVVTESERLEKEAFYNKVIPAGKGWMHDIKPNQTLRIVDLEGNQAVDTTFFNSNNPKDHYSATMTISAQRNIYLTTGTVLRSESGQPLLKITADTCGRHDTLGGACSPQSNTVRYAHEKIHMHACRDTFMYLIAQYQGSYAYSKRDLAPNINFFMNVPVTPEGALDFADGISAPGRYVEMTAVTNTTALISNCPQLNNPCNAYNPTPIRILIWDN
ncbi:urea amidolyase associated protein UAAP2 [Sporolactobacillus terrae]|uniref:Urea carboxylase n=1 Tax=Sporolactobacillus terrae TaxID=269673 RepID=A0A5K7WU81_9BACL|nr:urea amidolyase associated protein UAAP2 [Sporolactobacillus terrae]BBN97872.1 urea carboxylase [Sporolactobacillus terrae]